MGPDGQPCAAWQAADEKGIFVFKDDQPIETCPAPHASEIAALLLEDDNWGIYFTQPGVEQYSTQSRFLSAASAVYEGQKWYLWPSNKHFYNHNGYPYERYKKLSANFKAIVGADATGNF